MDGFIALLVLLALWAVIAPIVALVNAAGSRRDAGEARRETAAIRQRLEALERTLREIPKSALTPAPEAPPVAEPFAPPPLPRPVTPNERILPETEPPPAAPQPRKKLVDYGDFPAPPPAPAPVPKEPFSLEKFMGVKGFAWLGAIAMFFGVVFFVKYAFDNNLIPPSMRIALGFLTGAGLLVGGLLTHRRERYRVLAQAFCATGVLILYGVSFAAHAVYHFPWFGNAQTFALMACITFAAFLISVRLDALVVAVLGMLGGFLTPVLLSTGEDQVLALFGYIALLDVGLLAVSRHGKWRFLTPCAALGTALMQAGWWIKFFDRGHYFLGSAVLVPMGIVLGFLALFLAGGWVFQRKPGRRAADSVLGLAAVAILFAAVMLHYREIAERPFLLYGFVLLVNLAVIAVTTALPGREMARILVAGMTFLHLAAWTDGYLVPGNLTSALALYLLFGALHAVVPVIFPRPEANAGSRKASAWFAPLVLLMILLPLHRISPLPMLVWAAVLLADLLAIALAVAARAVVPVLVSLVLTLVLAGLWFARVPVAGTSLMPFLGLISGFSALFVVAGNGLAHLMRNEDGKSPDTLAAGLLPGASAALPFALLVLAILQVPLANPSPVFTVALLMSALLVGLAVIGKQGPLVLIALVGTLVVEGIWHLHHFQTAAPGVALPWYLGFYALFLALPFIFRRALGDSASPWIAAALSGVGHFVLIHDLVKRGFPNDFMGLVPAAFAVPAFGALFAVLRIYPEMDEKQRGRIAWLGGVALLFVTLIFPVQFHRQWITVSWAVEGALLLWLFRRILHPGLQLTGLALLSISFTRLALNPAVFLDYFRNGTPILNWHLYVYGTAAAAQFCGAAWLPDSHDTRPRSILQVFGGILLFLLLNIEIADFFTVPGSLFISFDFGGNFARDMTYSIGWGLFSLGLLGIGFWRGSKHARYAATGLLVVTLTKVFLHDLARTESVFRIGALIGVAVIAFAASFLYQRFFDRSKA